MNDKEFAQQIVLALIKRGWSTNTAIHEALRLVDDFNKACRNYDRNG